MESTFVFVSVPTIYIHPDLIYVSKVYIVFYLFIDKKKQKLFPWFPKRQMFKKVVDLL